MLVWFLHVIIILLQVFPVKCGGIYPGSLALGRAHSCSILDQNLYCFGHNAYGQLFLGHNKHAISSNPTTNTNTPFSGNVRSVSASHHQTCVVTDTPTANGQIVCCGLTGDRGTSPGDAVGSGGRCTDGTFNFIKFADEDAHTVIVHVTTAQGSACALFFPGLIRCWGDNTYGQLAIGSNAQKTAMTTIKLMNTFVVFSDTVTVQQIHGGNHHYCALFDNGGVRCWGRDYALGTVPGTAPNIGDQPVEIPLLNYVAWDPSWSLGNPAVSSLACGPQHNCVVFRSGEVVCWGMTATNALGRSNTNDPGRNASIPAANGPLAFSTSHPALGVSVGAQHSCALFSTGLRCWGIGMSTGYHDNATDVRIDAQVSSTGYVPIDDVKMLTHVVAGEYHTCVEIAPISQSKTISDPFIKCWGLGQNFRIGRFDGFNLGFDLSYPTLGPPSGSAPVAFLDGTIPVGDVFPSACSPETGVVTTFYGPMYSALTRATSLFFLDSLGGYYHLDFTPQDNTRIILPVPPRLALTPNPIPFGVYLVTADIEFHSDAPEYPVPRKFIWYDPMMALPALVTTNGKSSGGTTVVVSMLELGKLWDRVLPYCYVYASKVMNATMSRFDPSGALLLSSKGQIVGDTLQCPGMIAGTPGTSIPFFFNLGGNYGGFPTIWAGDFIYTNATLVSLVPTEASIVGDSTLNITVNSLVVFTDPVVVRFAAADSRANGAFYDVTPMLIVGAGNGTYGASLTSLVSVNVPPYFVNLTSDPNIPFPLQVKVSVSTNGGADFTNTLTYLMYKDPTLIQFDPLGSGAASEPAPDAQVSITAFSIIVRASGLRPTTTGRVKFTHSTSGDVLTFPTVTPLYSATQFKATGITLPIKGLWFVQYAQNGEDYTFSRLRYYVFQLDSVSPNAGPYTGGTNLILTGRGFTYATNLACQFSIAGFPTTTATVLDENTIACPTPAATGATPCSLTIKIGLAPDAILSNAISFDFKLLGINSITPFAVPANNHFALVAPPISPQTVTISGFGFYNTSAGNMLCRFNTFVYPVKILDPAGLFVTCNAPTTRGTYAVSLACNGQSFESSVGGLTYSVYQILVVRPTNMPTSQTAPITVFGEFFYNVTSFQVGCRYTRPGPTYDYVLGTMITTSQILCDLPPAPLPPMFTKLNVDVTMDMAGTPAYYSDEKLTVSYYPAASISAVNPLFIPATVSQLVTIWGSNFYPFNISDAVCAFGSSIVRAQLFTNGTISGSSPVTCLAPPGILAVTVSVSFNIGVTFTAPFTSLINYMAVFAFLPSLGPSAGGSKVLISGFGFQNLPTARCRVGDSSSTIPPVPAVYISGEQVRCVLPRTPSGNQAQFPVEYSADGSTYTRDNVFFSYYQTPRITGISPPGAPLGIGFTEITITGENFLTSGVSPQCTFGSALLPIATFDGSTIIAHPSSSSGSVSIAPIECSFNDGFDYTTDGWFFSVITFSGILVNKGPDIGGHVIQILGSGFQQTAGSRCFVFNGTDAASGWFIDATVISTALMTCIAPPISDGAKVSGFMNIDITMDSSYLTNTPKPYYYYPTPDITAMTPITGPASGGTVITLFAANKTLVDTNLAMYCQMNGANIRATLNGTIGPNNTVLPAPGGYLSCVTPPGVGRVPVMISINAGADFQTRNPTFNFLYTNALAIDPDNGPSAGGTMLYASGSGILNTGNNKCRFGTVLSSATVLSGTQLKCLVPPGLPSTVSFEISNDGLSFTTDGLKYTYFIDPMIFDLFPASGPVGGGTLVTVRGLNLQSLRGLLATKCAFGPVYDRAIATPSSAEVVCKSPPIADLKTDVGAFPLELSLNSGFDYTGDGVLFFYFVALSLSPTLGPVLGGTVVTVSGGGFVDFVWNGGGECLFGTYPPSQTTFLSTRSVTCLSPFVGNGTEPWESTFVTTVSLRAVGDVQVSEVTADLYKFYLPPNITTYNPYYGVKEGNTRLLLSALSLRYPFVATPSMRCRMNGQMSRAELIAETLVKCTSIPGLGTTMLQFSNNGQDFVDVGNFTYFMVISVFPTRGPNTGQTVVTVVGEGFADVGKSFLRCTFIANSIPTTSPATFVSPTMVICTTPSISRQMRRRRRALGALGALSESETRSSDDLQVTVSPDGTIGAPLLYPMMEDHLNEEDEFEWVEDEDSNESSSRSRFHANQEIYGVGFASITVNGFEYSTRPPSGAGDFTFYRIPDITALNPSTGPPAGRTPITLIGTGFPSNYSMYCKWGPQSNVSILESTPATYISDTQAVCQNTPNYPGPVTLLMSFNEQQYGRRPLWPIFVYVECKPGEYSISPLDPCVPCSPGEFSRKRGARKCLKCDPLTWTNETGSTECFSCPENSKISELKRDSIELCECLPGFYNPDGISGVACLPCPVGGLCAGARAFPVALPGYWASDNATTQFLRCENADACLGNGVSLCAPGYMGRVCSHCDTGYFHSGLKCQKCPPLAWLTIFVVPVYLFGTCIILYVTSGSFMSSYGGLLGIIIFYMQQVSILGRLKLSWPSRVQNVMVFMGAPFSLNLDILALECAERSLSFRARWLAMVASPFAFLLTMALVMLLSVCIRAGRSRKTPGRPDGRLPGPKEFAFNAYFRFLTLFYIALIVYVFQLFDCTKGLDGVATLDAQPDLVCYEPWWKTLMPIGVGAMFMYMAVLPILVFVVILKGKKRQRMPYTVGLMGGLTVFYKFVWWEMFSLFEKFILGTALTYFSGAVEIQVVGMLFVSVTGLAVHVLAQPYFFIRHNKLGTFLRWCMIFLLIQGIVFKSNQFPDKNVKPLVEATTYLVLLISVIAIIYTMLIDWQVRRRAYARFGPETERQLAALVHPKGKALILDWLGTTNAHVIVVDFPEVVNRLYTAFMDRVLEKPSNKDVARITDMIIDEFTTTIFYDKAVPYIRSWALEVSSKSGNENEEALRAFVKVIGDLKRHTFLFESKHSGQAFMG